MSAKILRAVLVLPIVAIVCSASTANAQWLPFFNRCQCAQPVAQTCYRTVPVTEYQQVQHTVRKPIVETKYVDQQVTEYRQVVESKTVDVPTVRYQTVTEYKNIQRNCGRWVAQRHCIQKIKPCEYDNRPTLLGSLNRTRRSIRNAITPNYRMTMQYVPQVVNQTVAVARTIPIHETRKVTYNITKLVPVTTTRKVAVNTVRYVDEVVTAMRPVTVYRTVPIGTSLAYATPTYTITGTQTATSPDPISAKKVPSRTANSNDNKTNDDAFTPRRDSSSNNDDGFTPVPTRKSSLSRPIRSSERSTILDGQRAENSAAPKRFRSVPSIVRISAWRATRQHRISNGPELTVPSLASTK